MDKSIILRSSGERLVLVLPESDTTAAFFCEQVEGRCFYALVVKTNFARKVPYILRLARQPRSVSATWCQPLPGFSFPIAYTTMFPGGRGWTNHPLQVICVTENPDLLDSQPGEVAVARIRAELEDLSNRLGASIESHSYQDAARTAAFTSSKGQGVRAAYEIYGPFLILSLSIPKEG